MKKIIISRLKELIIVLLGVTFFTFLVTYLAPSDGAKMYFYSRGITPTDAALESMRESMGLNEPMLIQYGKWFINVLQGDFGTSYQYGQAVSSMMLQKLPNTLLLAFSSFILVIIISIPAGILCAVKKDSLYDKIIRILCFGGISVPNFWLALILMYFLALKLHLFSITSQGMILPMFTLAIPLICSYTRQVRVAVLEELNSNYVIGLKAKGYDDHYILYKHILPHCIKPILTLVGLSFGHLLGGSAVVETIFSYQGIGEMVVSGIRLRDYPMIQAYVIYMAVIYVGVNLIVDLMQYKLDPHLRRINHG